MDKRVRRRSHLAFVDEGRCIKRVSRGAVSVPMARKKVMRKQRRSNEEGLDEKVTLCS
jgi:hypothetical protein